MANESEPQAEEVIPFDGSLLDEYDTLAKVPIASTNVAFAAYNRDNSRLFLAFLSGRIYAYTGVNEGTWQGLIHATSTGKYVWRIIRNNGADDIYDPKRVA